MIDSFFILKLILVILLLSSSAFFSGSETTLFSLSNIQLQKIRGSKKKNAKKIIDFLKKPRKILATILLGNELSNVSISIVIASLVYDILGASGFEINTIISILITTTLVLTFGEIIPKNIAIRYAFSLAPVIVVPLGFFYFIVNPIRSLLSKLADLIIRLFGGNPEEDIPLIMEEEFRYLLDLAHTKGKLHKHEHELIHKVLDFGDKIVRDIMTPANEIFSLQADTPYEILLESLKATQFSRVPIYKDNKNNIVGILYLKDVFKFHRSKEPEKRISDILRPSIFIDPGDRIEHLLNVFRQKKIHMAIVVDKIKGVVGLVTLDNILEELFGEMFI